MAQGEQTASGRRRLPLVVIGHVNHGKSALVRALTGTNTDRLKEEAARGMSITLGYAWRAYPQGEIDFIDAPGHEDFVRAMAMGASGAQAALLVVSASEGVARQTREHLRIAEALGVRAGVVAISKADLMAPDDIAAAVAAIQADLSGGFLGEAPVVACSAQTGLGLETLHALLGGLVEDAAPADAPLGAYLPQDRVFTLAGTGTVVTGTLLGDGLSAGQSAVLQPSGQAVVLRQVQVHGQAVDRALPGGRVAVALRGAADGTLSAGEVLCAPGLLEPSTLVDVALTLDAGVALKPGAEVRVLWGARQDVGHVRMIGPDFAQLRFRTPVPAFAGQRAALRRLSPAATIGAAVVLDPVAPPLRARQAADRGALLAAVRSRDVEAVAGGLARRGGGLLATAELSRLIGRPAPELLAALPGFSDLGDGKAVDIAAERAGGGILLDELARLHHEAPLQLWASARTLRGRLAGAIGHDMLGHLEARLASDGAILVQGDRVRLAGHDPLARLSPGEEQRLLDIEAMLDGGGMTPPAVTEDRALFDLLVETGRLVALRNVALRQTVVFHPAALQRALDALRAAFPPPAAFATGEAREALGTSRKFIVPVLEWFDDQGVTAREGDLRRLVADKDHLDLSGDRR